jgi:hypothetical protein
MCEEVRLPGVGDVGELNVMEVSGPKKQAQIYPENRYRSEKVNRRGNSIYEEGKRLDQNGQRKEMARSSHNLVSPESRIALRKSLRLDI